MIFRTGSRFFFHAPGFFFRDTLLASTVFSPLVRSFSFFFEDGASLLGFLFEERISGWTRLPGSTFSLEWGLDEPYDG